MGKLTRPDGYAISDFGRTFAKVAEYQMNVRYPRNRRQIISDMARPFKVEVMQQDRLVVILDGPDTLGDGLIRLGQACLSVSSLVYTRRSTRPTTLAEEVKLVIDDADLSYEVKYPHNGPRNKPIPVDYRVKGPFRMSSILTLGPHHSQAADAYIKWSDLKYVKIEDRFITIFDDRSGYDRSDDIARLERVSEVISIKNPKMIEHALRAA